MKVYLPKKCPKCGGDKTAGPHHWQCKKCKNEYQKKYYRENEHARQYHSEYHKGYYARNAEKVKKGNEAYRNANKEKLRKAARKRYRKNRKKRIETVRKYRTERKERLCQLNPKTRREKLMILKKLLFQTEEALRKENREALSLLSEKYELLATMAV